jgi:hypothetical protein
MPWLSLPQVKVEEHHSAVGSITGGSSQVQPFRLGAVLIRQWQMLAGVPAMRSAVVILVLCGLILLAFSPVWYEALAGGNRVIVDPTEASLGIGTVALLQS